MVQSLKKSPSAVISKYYQNYGKHNNGQTGTKTENTTSSQMNKKGKKDLTITFQKERSGDHTYDSNHKLFLQTDEDLRASKESLQLKKKTVLLNLANNITQLTSFQSSALHQRTQSCKGITQQPQIKDLNAQKRQETNSQNLNPVSPNHLNTFFNATQSQNSEQHPNKLAAMTCILKGLQHLNQSEFGQNMQKQVFEKHASSPQFQQRLTFDFQMLQNGLGTTTNVASKPILGDLPLTPSQSQLNQQQHTQFQQFSGFHNQQKLNQLERQLLQSPHFFIPENNDEFSMSNHNIIEEQKQEDDILFVCPGVSPVQTNKQSFAEKEEQENLLTPNNIFAQLIMRKQSQGNLADQSEVSLIKNLNKKQKSSFKQIINISNNEGEAFSITEMSCLSQSVGNGVFTYNLKDFKEEYFKFGLWPELGFMEQQLIKKEALSLNRENNNNKLQVQSLQKANQLLQENLQNLQQQQSRHSKVTYTNYQKRDTQFSNKKQNNRYVCQNCTNQTYSQVPLQSNTNQSVFGISQNNNNNQNGNHICSNKDQSSKYYGRSTSRRNEQNQQLNENILGKKNSFSIEDINEALKMIPSNNQSQVQNQQRRKTQTYQQNYRNKILNNLKINIEKRQTLGSLMQQSGQSDIEKQDYYE